MWDGKDVFAFFLYRPELCIVQFYVIVITNSIYNLDCIYCKHPVIFCINLEDVFSTIQIY